LDNNVLNNPPANNSGQFQNVVGQATSTSTNIAGVFAAFSQRVIDALRSIPIYQVFILLLLLLGIGFVLQGAFIKDTQSMKAYAAFMRGAAVLAVASVFNVLNTLSFMLNPTWLTQKTGLTLPWVLGLDMANAIAVVVVSLSVLFALYNKISKLTDGPLSK
ncbi:MAG TPA: hypothetical protein VFT82_02855, partial [Candidatus Paceibacterota bacterium]|nr:hypothetical protein [Candidatus Paceibacterota bacterium]